MRLLVSDTAAIVVSLIVTFVMTHISQVMMISALRAVLAMDCFSRVLGLRFGGPQGVWDSGLLHALRWPHGAAPRASVFDSCSLGCRMWSFGCERFLFEVCTGSAGSSKLQKGLGFQVLVWLKPPCNHELAHGREPLRVRLGDRIPHNSGCRDAIPKP